MASKCDCGFPGNPNMFGHSEDCAVAIERKQVEVPEVLTGQVPVSVFAEEFTEVIESGCTSRVYPIETKCPDEPA